MTHDTDKPYRPICAGCQRTRLHVERLEQTYSAALSAQAVRIAALERKLERLDGRSELVREPEYA